MPEPMSASVTSTGSSKSTLMHLGYNRNTMDDDSNTDDGFPQPLEDTSRLEFHAHVPYQPQERPEESHQNNYQTYEKNLSHNMNGDLGASNDLEAGYNAATALSEVNHAQIHPFTNHFIGANDLEVLYRRNRLKETAPLLRWASGLLLLCLILDCLSVTLLRNTVHIGLYIALCVITCFQLCLFIFRNRLYSHLLLFYYQYTTVALSVSAFAYVILSDTLLVCVLYGRTEPLCDDNGEQLWYMEDTTRVAYCMSLLFGILPFGFRVNFLACVVIYTCALVLHIILRVAAFVTSGLEGTHGTVFNALLLDAFFLLIIMVILLYGAYMYERNDRVVFLRLRKSQLESDQLHNELEMVREELGWAEDEANTNEIKLEIERAKADLDRMYQHAQKRLESWVIPIDALVLDKRVGEGSFGEVFRGRIKVHHQNYGGDMMYDRVGDGLLPRVASTSMRSFSSQRSTYLGNLQSPQHQDQEFESAFGEDSLGTLYTHRTSPVRKHHRKYSTMPNNSVVAIKRIPKHKINRKTVLSLLQETYAMALCRHPNVLRLVGVVFDPFVCVVFEYMALGSLKDLLDASNPRLALQTTQRFSKGSNPALLPLDASGKGTSMWHSMRERDEDIFHDAERKLQRDSVVQELQDYALPGQCVWTHTKTRMCVNIAAGVSYLHSQGIIHRDLKSSNLMVDATHAVKVADLGTARDMDPRRAAPQDVSDADSTSNEQPGHERRTRPRRMSRVGSPLWIAPEVIRSENGEYSYECDVWSFGVILCEIMTHRDPYTDVDGRSNFNLLQVVEGQLSPLDFIDDALEHTPSGIVQLAQACCEFDPAKRCSMREALFELLRIVVEQETSKVEADAIAAAGPYIRYSQPSRVNLFRHLRPSFESEPHGQDPRNHIDSTQMPTPSPSLPQTNANSCARNSTNRNVRSNNYSVHTLSSSDVIAEALHENDLDHLVHKRRHPHHCTSQSADDDENLDSDSEEDETESEDDDLHEDEFPLDMAPYARGSSPANTASTNSGTRLLPGSQSTFGESSATGAFTRVGVADESMGSVEGSSRLMTTPHPFGINNMSQQSLATQHPDDDYDNIGSSRRNTKNSRRRSKERPRSLVTVKTDTTCTTFAGSSRTLGAPPLMMEYEEPMHYRALRQSYSTHNMGETLIQEKVQSLLSSFPSMGSIVPPTFAGFRDRSSDLSSREPSAASNLPGSRLRESATSSHSVASDQQQQVARRSVSIGSERSRRQSQSCRITRESSAPAVGEKQSHSMRGPFQCIAEF